MRRFGDLIFAYLVGGHPHLAEPYIVPGNLEPLVGVLRDGFELFVVGHEIGHVILGHLDGQRPMRARSEMSSFDTEKTYEIFQAWQKEFEADIFGMQMVMASNSRRRFDIALSYVAVDFFFLSIEAIRRCAARINQQPDGDDSSESHPPPSMRREFLKEWLRTAMSKQGSEAMESVFALSQTVESIFRRLEAALDPVVEAAAKRGIRTTAEWRGKG